MTTLNRQVQSTIIKLYINQILKDLGIEAEASKKKLIQIISHAIEFNKKLIWENSSKNIYLATTTREFIEIFKLRSEIYTELKCDNEFFRSLWSFGTS